MIYRVLGFIFCEFLAVIWDQLIIDSCGWHIHVLIAFCLFQSVFFVICLQIIHGQVIYRNICLFANTYFFASIIICSKQLLFPVLHHKEAALSFLYSKNFPLYSKWIWNTAGNLVYSTVYFVNFWQSCFAIGIAGYQVDFSGLHEICHTVYVDVPVWPFKAGHSFVDPDFKGQQQRMPSGYAVGSLIKKAANQISFVGKEGILMTLDEMIAVISLCITVFSLGYTLGSDHHVRK